VLYVKDAIKIHFD